ncbi:MAG: hypothetical protein BMS9Abin08_0052 [Gammaproteobacteria bacterium]|nr:MAG: hypothetical protein BMS9Abin08_0052 [Gammaproteobacteria bacterium]
MNYSTVTGALCASVLAFMSTATNAASLVDLGGGLIYDDDQDLTWTQNAGMSGWLNWQEATDWAANLVFGGVGGWRLPITTQFDDPTCSPDARGGFFFESRLDCLGGEMELLTALADPWTNDLFKDENGNTTLNKTRYWTAAPYRDGIDPCINFPNYDVACTLANDDGDRTGFYWQWGFTGWGGINGPAYKTTMKGTADRYAWAVHDGKVSAVPVPAAIYLFGSGLVGLFGVMKRKAG